MKKILLQTFKEYFSHNPFSLAAALSFYSLIAFPSFVILLVFLSAISASQNSLSPPIYSQIENFFGKDARDLLSQIFQNLPPLRELKFVSLITFFAFLFGGLGFFEQLQTAFHTFWGIRIKKKLGFKGYLKNQLFLLGTMISCGALFMASAMTEILFSQLSNLFSQIHILQKFLPLMGFTLGILLMMMVFTFFYKFLTQAYIEWKEALFGASITTILFTIGKYISVLLLSHNATLSSYGAASTIVIFLLFVYYSSQAIFIGAVATKIHAKNHGRKIRPNKNSVSTESVWNQLMRRV
jgi:membrane protein